MTAILTDPHLRQCLADIVKQTKVSCIVETGTNDGTSTVEFAKLVPRVFTVEVDGDLHAQAKARVPANVHCEHGGSASFLWTCLKIVAAGEVINGDNVLLFLDAHWNETWPLRLELQAINAAREAGYKFVVMVDDFFVPNRPNFVGCYGGLRSADSDGRESELIPCGYNPPFAEELDKFPRFYYPDYDLGTMGYCIASDFDLELGDKFRRVR